MFVSFDCLLITEERALPQISVLSHETKKPVHPYIDCCLSYEGTNITGERVVNHPRTQLNDALMES